MFQLGIIIFVVIRGHTAFPYLDNWPTDDMTKGTPSGYVFECTAVGIFPDPYVCTTYHVCYESETVIQHDEQECEHGYIYNALSKSCSTRASQCPEEPPVPTCSKKDQLAALSENPNIYYYCVPSADGTYLYPILYECPHGGYFDDAALSCLASTTSTTSTARTTASTAAPTTATTPTTTRTTTTPTTTITTTTITTPTTTAEVPFHCTVPGTYADEKDCHSYYECTVLLQATHHTCPSETHFSPVFRICLIGTCTNAV